MGAELMKKTDASERRPYLIDSFLKPVQSISKIVPAMWRGPEPMLK